MSRADLEVTINQIVDDKKVSRDKKIERIFEITKPEEVSQEDHKKIGLNFWLNEGEWTQLKFDHKFWLDVIRALGFVEVEAVNNMGNKIFSLPEIASILGDDMAFRLMQQGNLFDLPAMEQQIYAKQQFMEYMLWYDEHASMNYLVLYGRYLAIKDQLVSIQETRVHRQGDTNVSNNIVAMDSTYHVVSNLTVVSQSTVYAFFFYQKKGMDAPLVIQQGRNTKEVPVSGPILRVLKFFYPKASIFSNPARRMDTVYLVLMGPDDNKLLRFSHLNIQDVLVVDHFKMVANDFDDLVYASDIQATRFATNTKSVTKLENLHLVDLGRLCEMAPQAIRPLSSLTRAEKVKLLEQRQTQTASDTPGYLDIKTEYDYGKLYVRFAEPITVRFVQESSYTDGQVELLAVKIIRLPSERSELSCHIATLVRQYTNDMGEFNLQLRFYRYNALQNGQYTSAASRIIRLENFLTRNTELTKSSIHEMNIVFHTDTIFHVEVMEHRVIMGEDEFGVVNSQLLEFDFLYNRSLEVIPDIVTLPQTPGMALFEDARLQKYKIIDFRNDTLPISAPRERRYDAIFYRYNMVKAYARFLFYKLSDGVPTIVECRIDQLKPNHLMGFVSIPSPPGLAFILFGTEELTETSDGRLTYQQSDTPSIAKITLSDKTKLGPYENDESFTLSSNLATKLTITKPISCSFCGDKAHMKDTKSGKCYCDHFCQRLFCQTYRLR